MSADYTHILSDNGALFVNKFEHPGTRRIPVYDILQTKEITNTRASPDMPFFYFNNDNGNHDFYTASVEMYPVAPQLEKAANPIDTVALFSTAFDQSANKHLMHNMTFFDNHRVDIHTLAGLARRSMHGQSLLLTLVAALHEDTPLSTIDEYAPTIVTRFVSTCHEQNFALVTRTIETVHAQLYADLKKASASPHLLSRLETCNMNIRTYTSTCDYSILPAPSGSDAAVGATLSLFAGVEEVLHNCHFAEHADSRAQSVILHGDGAWHLEQLPTRMAEFTRVLDQLTLLTSLVPTRCVDIVLARSVHTPARAFNNYVSKVSAEQSNRMLVQYTNAQDISSVYIFNMKRTVAAFTYATYSTNKTFYATYTTHVRTMCLALAATAGKRIRRLHDALPRGTATANMYTQYGINMEYAYTIDALNKFMRMVYAPSLLQVFFNHLWPVDNVALRPEDNTPPNHKPRTIRIDLMDGWHRWCRFSLDHEVSSVTPLAVQPVTYQTRSNVFDFIEHVQLLAEMTRAEMLSNNTDIDRYRGAAMSLMTTRENLEATKLTDTLGDYDTTYTTKAFKEFVDSYMHEALRIDEEFYKSFCALCVDYTIAKLEEEQPGLFHRCTTQVIEPLVDMSAQTMKIWHIMTNPLFLACFLIFRVLLKAGNDPRLRVCAVHSIKTRFFDIVKTMYHHMYNALTVHTPDYTDKKIEAIVHTLVPRAPTGPRQPAPVMYTPAHVFPPMTTDDVHNIAQCTMLNMLYRLCSHDERHILVDLGADTCMRYDMRTMLGLLGLKMLTCNSMTHANFSIDNAYARALGAYMLNTDSHTRTQNNEMADKYVLVSDVIEQVGKTAEVTLKAVTVVSSHIVSPKPVDAAKDNNATTSPHACYMCNSADEFVKDNTRHIIVACLCCGRFYHYGGCNNDNVYVDHAFPPYCTQVERNTCLPDGAAVPWGLSDNQLDTLVYKSGSSGHSFAENNQLNRDNRAHIDMLDSADRKMIGYWTWTPSRDYFQDNSYQMSPTPRTFLVSDKTNVDIFASPTGIMEHTLQVPVQDGYEGTYTYVLESSKYGRKRADVHLRLKMKCKRTGVLFEQAVDNAKWPVPRLWTRNNIVYTGWFSAYTDLPYTSMLPRGIASTDLYTRMSLAEWLFFMGDVVYDSKDMPAIFYKHRAHFLTRPRGSETVPDFEMEIVRFFMHVLSSHRPLVKVDDLCVLPGALKKMIDSGQWPVRAHLIASPTHSATGIRSTTEVSEGPTETYVSPLATSSSARQYIDKLRNGTILNLKTIEREMDNTVNAPQSTTAQSGIVATIANLTGMIANAIQAGVQSVTTSLETNKTSKNESRAREMSVELFKIITTNINGVVNAIINSKTKITDFNLFNRYYRPIPDISTRIELMRYDVLELSQTDAVDRTKIITTSLLAIAYNLIQIIMNIYSIVDHVPIFLNEKHSNRPIQYIADKFSNSEKCCQILTDTFTNMISELKTPYHELHVGNIKHVIDTTCNLNVMYLNELTELYNKKNSN